MHCVDRHCVVALQKKTLQTTHPVHPLVVTLNLAVDQAEFPYRKGKQLEVVAIVNLHIAHRQLVDVGKEGKQPVNIVFKDTVDDNVGGLGSVSVVE